MAQTLQALLQQGHDAASLFANYGYTTSEIAAAMGVTPRWVRKLIERAGVRPPKKPEPSKLMLYSILLREVARHGGDYGWGYLRGVLRAHHPGYHFARRRVIAALKRLFPKEASQRQHYTAQRLERGRCAACTRSQLRAILPPTQLVWNVLLQVPRPALCPFVAPRLRVQAPRLPHIRGCHRRWLLAQVRAAAGATATLRRRPLRPPPPADPTTVPSPSPRATHAYVPRSPIARRS